MKRCPSCNRTYTDTSLNFCLEDGTPLVADAPPMDPNATIRYSSPRDTAEPPPTEIYRPEPLRQPAPPPPPPPQWAATPPPVRAPVQPKKSNAVWWILGGLAAFAIIGIGLLVMIIAIASMSGDNTNNRNVANVNNNRVDNRNINVVANANVSENVNSSSLPAQFNDDFSQPKWGVGDSKFGRIWYADDEYHMTSKDRTYIVMYAPSDDYSTENATVKVTARSVDGTVPSSGFGLMVHCVQTKAKQLEDYALLIYPGDTPQYEVIMHKDGNQSSLVSKTNSSAIRSGSNPNQLEIRIKGTELAFYVNGQYLTRITDTANYRRGRVGLYTSDINDIAFDDLEIQR
ncbi:MAG TPA: hypothetical protein VFD63_12640 [Pyrinomonadaceae bacterium]|nr:hypothetical protein [Pyrinomonadaceae bacterium]